MTILETMRLRAGMTQAQLAEKSGIAQGAISKIENRERMPRVATIQKLSRALGVDPLVMLKGIMEEEEPLCTKD